MKASESLVSAFVRTSKLLLLLIGLIAAGWFWVALMVLVTAVALVVRFVRTRSERVGEIPSATAPPRTVVQPEPGCAASAVQAAAQEATAPPRPRPRREWRTRPARRDEVGLLHGEIEKLAPSFNPSLMRWLMYYDRLGDGFLVVECLEDGVVKKSGSAIVIFLTQAGVEQLRTLRCNIQTIDLSEIWHGNGMPAGAYVALLETSPRSAITSIERALVDLVLRRAPPSGTYTIFARPATKRGLAHQVRWGFRRVATGGDPEIKQLSSLVLDMDDVPPDLLGPGTNLLELRSLLRVLLDQRRRRQRATG
jgi:hypothetical protein